MQPRLTRSRNEVIIAGVCGGLAEYFGIDPVIVRLIFVLVTLTSGIGLLVYPILWLVMPKAGAPAAGFPPGAEEWRRRVHEFGQEAAETGQQIGREVREVLLREQLQQARSRTEAQQVQHVEAPPPHAYNFDPLTGQPISPSTPTTGQTINLDAEPFQAPIASHPTADDAQQPGYAPAAPPARRRRWRSIGVLLMGAGVFILADQFGIDTDIIFPIMMIIGGLLLLRRR